MRCHKKLYLSVTPFITYYVLSEELKLDAPSWRPSIGESINRRRESERAREGGKERKGTIYLSTLRLSGTPE